MPKSIKVEINPKVFKWLREISGWTIEEVSVRLRTSIEAIESIESGEKPPTLWQLKELSKAYKRPLASFFLSKPLRQPPMPKDYRMIPDKKDTFDRKTIYAIRRARSLQDIGHDLLKNIEHDTEPEIRSVTIRRDPEKLAAEYRTKFNLSEERQRRFRNAYEFRNFMRDALEDLNILVFQFSMPVEDARGFVLTDRTPYVIVINSKDIIEARLFSLMHEFAHILLGETVIDLPDFRAAAESRIERWCNRFAASFLLPREVVTEIFDSTGVGVMDTRTLNRYSSRYKVSKAMLLYSLKDLGLISREEYRSVLDRYTPTRVEEPVEEEGAGGWGRPGHERCLSEVGNRFVTIVADNFDRNHITYNDALSFLSVRSKHFEKVLSKARK
jgi:Zn-dependent peptidase ImmA (M78 family)